MERFTCITATACPLPAENIDTDQILPARYLKLPRKGEHGKVLFHDLRFDGTDRERPDFPLNRPCWRDAGIIVSGRNFGGGSSREAAVYALYDYGIRCVIAPSFGDIFSQNATKNGLLAAVVSEAESGALLTALTREPASGVTVDLGSQSIVCGVGERGGERRVAAGVTPRAGIGGHGRSGIAINRMRRIAIPVYD